MSRLLITRPGHVYLATYHADANTFQIDYDLALPGCPSWLAVDRTRSLVYIVDEDSSKFYRFHLDAASATPFTQQLTADTASPGAVYLAFSQDKRRLLSAVFGSSAVDVWDVTDGSRLERLMEKTVVSDGNAGPVSHIQDAPHPHQVLLDPTGRFYVVPDLGTDEVLVIDSKNDAFTISNRVALPPGSGPRHGAFYPVGAPSATHYMLLCELTNTVVVFALQYTNSALLFTKIAEESTFGAERPPPTARAGHLELLSDNKHLYVTNRLTGRPHDSIVCMRIRDGERHPTLEFEQEIATLGVLPRMFCVLDGGRGDIIAANENSPWALVVLARDAGGRMLADYKLRVPMSEFMDEAEMKTHPGNGPKFILEL